MKRSKSKTTKESLIIIDKDLIIICIVSIVLTLVVVLGARKLRDEKELQKVENNNVIENVTEDSDNTNDKNRSWSGADLWFWTTSMNRIMGIGR